MPANPHRDASSNRATVTGQYDYLRRGPRGRVRNSTLVILGGVALFVLPVPGTFVLGGLAILAGLVARLLGW